MGRACTICGLLVSSCGGLKGHEAVERAKQEYEREALEPKLGIMPSDIPSPFIHHCHAFSSFKTANKLGATFNQYNG